MLVFPVLKKASVSNNTIDAIFNEMIYNTLDFAFSKLFQ